MVLEVVGSGVHDDLSKYIWNLKICWNGRWKILNNTHCRWIDNEICNCKVLHENGKYYRLPWQFNNFWYNAISRERMMGLWEKERSTYTKITYCRISEKKSEEGSWNTRRACRIKWCIIGYISKVENGRRAMSSFDNIFEYIVHWSHRLWSDEPKQLTYSCLILSVLHLWWIGATERENRICITYDWTNDI